MKNPVKTFCDAGAVTMDYFLAQLSDEQQKLVRVLFDDGFSLLVALEIRQTEQPRVMLEAAHPNGTRQIIAHVRGVMPTMQ